MVYLAFGFFSRAQTDNFIVEYNTVVTMEKNLLVEERTFLIQVNNKESDWIADIEIPFGGTEKLEILEASVMAPDGMVARKLKKKDIITRSDISRGTFFEDSYVKEFSLKWHEYPYRIMYSYRSTVDHYLSVKWSPLMYANVPVKKATLQVAVPFDRAVRVNASGELTYRLDSLEKSYQHTWISENVDPLAKEKYAPPAQELIPGVTITPLEFMYETTGNAESWNTYGQWVYNLNQGLDVLTPSEGMKVNELVATIQNPKEKVKILYHYLQDNTRYINVAIDVGGLKSYPASYVCTNKYGDCKALTTYMKAMLKHVGIESFYVDIYAGENPLRINEINPGQQFNHVILCVPIDGDTLWLENTSKYKPYNYMGTFTQNRKALLIADGSSRLVQTPPLERDDVLEFCTYNFSLDMTGNGRVKVLLDLKGPRFEEMKYIQNEFTTRDKVQILQRMLPLKNANLEEWNFINHDRDEARIELVADLSVTRQLRKIDEIMAINTLPVSMELPERPSDRKTPVRINFPVNKVDSMIYTLPFVGHYTVNFPEPHKVETKYGVFSEEYIKKEDQIIVVRHFELFRGDYSLEEYPAFYNFFEEINKHLKRSIILLKPI